MTEATQRTSDNGVSIWLDDLSRSRIESGSLQDLIANKNVVGVTTNPSIFQKALSQVGPYDAQLKELGKVDVETAVRELTTTDVRNATDIFREIAEATDFVDGRVSIEVDPRLAHETEATEKQAEELWAKVNRPNAMIKIPATLEGLPAITATLAKGISVNVTLIFSLERYEQVIDAYIEGIAQAAANGHDLKHIGSVASFFVSRVDTAVDKLLEANGSDEAKALEGKAAVANARLAYELFEKKFAEDPRWADLAAKGAKVQRPLWASTGTKNAAYSDCKYVDELVAKHIVNTMPEKTLNALADHGRTKMSDMQWLCYIWSAVIDDHCLWLCDLIYALSLVFCHGIDIVCHIGRCKDKIQKSRWTCDDTFKHRVVLQLFTDLCSDRDRRLLVFLGCRHSAITLVFTQIRSV